MENKNETITNLQNLLDFNLRKLRNAEVDLEKMLPTWIRQAGSEKLKAVLQKYLEFVEQHLRNLESFSQLAGSFSLGLKNNIVAACLEELREKISLCTDASIRDVCLLSGVQVINHFKISAYGTVAAFARALNLEQLAAVFHEAEVNEKQIDDRLSQLAEHETNLQAVTPIVLHP